MAATKRYRERNGTVTMVDSDHDTSEQMKQPLSSEMFLRKSSNANSFPGSQPKPCDACPYCNDSCGVPDCPDCDSASVSEQYCSPCADDGQPTFTLCEVRRHASSESAWLVAGRDVFDATDYMSKHPGGLESILRRAGGKEDCTRDLKFHSKAGASSWKKYHIGVLRECPKESCGEETRPWWSLFRQ